VIALYPEVEEATALDHFVVGLLIFSVSSHIADILPQFTASHGRDEIDDVGYNNQADGS
jgi:hypothetical protein